MTDLRRRWDRRPAVTPSKLQLLALLTTTRARDLPAAIERAAKLGVQRVAVRVDEGARDDVLPRLDRLQTARRAGVRQLIETRRNDRCHRVHARPTICRRGWPGSRRTRRSSSCPIRYALAVDGRDLDAWVGLFEPDVEHGPARAAAARRCATYIEPQLRWFYRSIHQIVGHRIEIVDDDTATGAVYCRAEHEVGDRWIVMAICYFDDYRRVDGEWLFARRAEKHWYAADVLERPAGRRLRLVGHEQQPKALPHQFPTWTAFFADEDALPAGITGPPMMWRPSSADRGGGPPSS